MRTQTLTSTPAAPHRRAAHADAIAWEELPSLVDTLSLRLITQGGLRVVDLDLSAANSVSGALDAGPRRMMTWDNTMPAELDPPVQAEPFREALQGLAMREVREPDVFRHFFG
jgi:hypothetical protein